MSQIKNIKPKVSDEKKIFYCPNCSTEVPAEIKECGRCRALFSEGGWKPAVEKPPTSSLVPYAFLKATIYLAGVLVAIIALGLLLPEVIPRCYCNLQSGCEGCGGIIGNTMASFALTCFALGAIGYILLIWFGLPAVVLILIIWLIYEFFIKGKSSSPHSS